MGKGREVERLRQKSLTQIGHRYGIGTHCWHLSLLSCLLVIVVNVKVDSNMKESAAFLLIQRKSECTKPLQIPLGVKASGDEVHCLYKHGYTQRDAAFLWIWSIIMIHLLSVKSIYSVLSHCNTFTLLAQICLIVFCGYFCCCFLLWILYSMWFSFHFRKMTLFFIFLKIVIVETLNNISCADLKSETNEEKCFRSSGEWDCDSTCCKKKSDNIKIYGLFIC